MKYCHLKRIAALSIPVIITLLSFCSCKKSGNPVISNPGEGKWEVISDVGRGIGLGQIFFIDNQNGWIAGDSGKIVYTSNGGSSWTEQASGTKEYLRSIYFIDKNNGFTGGAAGTFLFTSDGGRKWTPVSTLKDSGCIISSIHSDNNKLWFIDNAGKIFYSEDQGRSWQIKNDFQSFGYIYLKFFSNAAFAARAIGNEIKRTTDGGNSWGSNKLPVEFMGDIFFLNDKQGWVTENWAASSLHHDSASVYSTIDGGESWKKIATVKSLENSNVVFKNQQTGWFNDWANIYGTEDGGKTFKTQFTLNSSEVITKLYFLDESHGWALTFSGKVIRYSRQ